MMSAEEQREMDRLKAVNEGLQKQIKSLQDENLQLLRMIGAITYKNDGRIRISKCLIADMIKHSIAVYDDIEKLEYVISVY